MQPQLAPADDKGNVLYHEFLQRYDVEHVSQQVPAGLKPAFHALYDQYPLLRAVSTSGIQTTMAWSIEPNSPEALEC